MKTLGLITKEYNRRFRRPGFNGRYGREEKGRGFEKRSDREDREEREERKAKEVLKIMMEEVTGQRDVSSVANLAT